MDKYINTNLKYTYKNVYVYIFVYTYKCEHIFKYFIVTNAHVSLLILDYFEVKLKFILLD